VGGAADAVLLTIELDDGYGCFGRDARHPANQELVEHHVADDEDAGGRETVRQLAGARAGQYRQRRRRVHGRSVRSAANGSVSITRKSIRNSESPKLCSNKPAPSMPAIAASPPA